MNSNQKGFSAAHLLIGLVVVGLIGFAGWRVYDSQNSTNDQPASVVQEEDSVPQVNSASDLNEMESYLNSQDIDKDLDTSELDEALSE